jgi:hypothetical protein
MRTVIVSALSASTAPSVLASVSVDRLRRFRQAVPNGQHSAVVALYTLDFELASAFHASIRAVEILLRETIHRALTATFGLRWFDSPSFLQTLDEAALKAISQAKKDAMEGSRVPAAGTVVAKIMLGTWVQLLARGPRGIKEDGLWIPALSSVFQADRSTTPLTRIDVHGLALRLRWARNRVNHCEPVVFGFPLVGQMTRAQALRRLTPQQMLDDLRRLAFMMDPAVGCWLSSWG